MRELFWLFGKERENMINDKIFKLRKKKNITQEELARAIGVTNQAVSKWESLQCCPDISLIPAIADYFGVTTDELFGHDVKEDKPADAVRMVRNTIGALPEKEAYECALRLAFVTHASLIARLMAEEGNPGFDPESAIDHAELGEWGTSSVGTPEITTAMSGGTVIFSDNKSRFACDSQIKDAARILRIFSDEDALRVMAVVFSLTSGSDDSFAGIDEISGKSGLGEETVVKALEKLDAFTERKDDKVRVRGDKALIVPLLSLVTAF